ncbi:hypothetical protein FCM35_KLT19617 [Carex littledalei]|uniref:TF-B3 domain-containing protein n=1 Tax=Carex littledalei TaxID=544730 RepID=A0A833VFQ5_9POAL|nr:hypothetical protein FCM35_KLT19617 [Carex littledalei]
MSRSMCLLWVGRWVWVWVWVHGGVAIGIDNFPPKHSRITLRLPQGSRSWRVKCRYSCQSRPRWFFYEGWSDFTRDNNLEGGRRLVCV